MDQLQALQTFVRVVELGSFSAAAKDSGSTQSAVSKQVAALEQRLGAKLLTRSTRSLKLTEPGERYFEQVRRLVVELAEADNTLRQGEQRLQGWLRVGASVGFGRLKLMPVVQSFMARHQEVKIDLRLDDGYVDLIEQGIDVAVRIGELSDSSLLARRIGTTRRAVLASRDYLRSLPAGVGAPRIPADLAQHNCILYSELSTRNAWTFVAGAGAQAPVGQRETVLVEGRMRTNSSEVVRASVIAGLGLGYSPCWLFEAEMSSGEVVPLLSDWSVQDMPIQAVCLPQRRHTAKVQAFIEHLAAESARFNPPSGPASLSIQATPSTSTKRYD